MALQVTKQVQKSSFISDILPHQVWYIIKGSFWVIPKTTSATLCQPIHDINYSTFWVATVFMIWGGITNIFEEICQNLAQNMRRIEEISHMYVLVDLTFTDVMCSNITIYSRRNTRLTVGKKWTFNMKLCNLYYIILTIWTYRVCTSTNT